MKLVYYNLLFTLFSFGFAAVKPLADIISAHDNFKIESRKVGETKIINVWITAESFNWLYFFGACRVFYF